MGAGWVLGHGLLCVLGCLHPASTKYPRPRLTVALRHVPAFDSPRKPSSWLAHPAQLKMPNKWAFLIVRDGRIELPISVWKTEVIPFN